MELHSLNMLQELPPPETASYSFSTVASPPLAVSGPRPAEKICPSAAACCSKLEEFWSLLQLCNVADDS